MTASAVRQEFEAAFAFSLDAFQADAMDAIDKGHSVLVAAPTGSGKTVVAEYAIECALAEGARAFYTTPLKALSNQKFNDLVARHGAARVGLLTGDTVVRPEADVIVMTTEVLRNMIYARSSNLDRLRWVILDEVHYLQNPYRGAVWEEVIIHLPTSVDLVCLSATVSNAEDVADWIGTVRGATDAIIDETRPVQLEHMYLAGERDSERMHLVPTFVDGLPNKFAARLDSRDDRDSRRGGDRRRRRVYTPRRVEVAHELDSHDMLPAVYFIFSRKGCDEAVRQCVNAGLRVTSPAEREQIRATVDAHMAGLSDADLDALGYETWLSGLEMGFASHHAGLVPPMKEAVEALFAAALVKLVFATETLSLGINMPARSVVIEKLTKFTGDRHEMLTAGEYTQFTGRAGRRGLDDVGYAVVLWSPFVSFEQVAALASRRTYALRSSFRPTYNMAANLIRRYAPDEARHLLNLSFAQYRADRVVVQHEAAIERLVHDIARAYAQAECEKGDVKEYRLLVAEAEEARRNAPSGAHEVVEAMQRLRPGDIVVIPSHRANGRVAVLSPARGKGLAVLLPVVTDDGRRLQLRVKDFPVPPRRAGHVKLPTPFDPTAAKFLRAAGDLVRHAEVVEPDEVRTYTPKWQGGKARVRGRTPSERLATMHPVASCPDASQHLKALARAERLERSLVAERRQRRSDEASLGRQLDRVLTVLGALEFVDGWKLTSRGERLARLYHECDLLIADCVGAGILDGLEPAQLAALVSVFTFEARGVDVGGLPVPAGLHARITAIESHLARIAGLEKRAHLPLTRDIDDGFVGAAYAWAKGEALHDVLADGITGGDFVRNIKQLVDLLRQIALVASNPETQKTASQAADALFRGVVVASSVVGTRDD